MTYTEEEAKTKWCPFARTSNFAATSSSNRDFQSPVDKDFAFQRTNCIGSACMAWRWHNDDEWVKRANAEYQRTGALMKPERGHCGLAGQP